MIESAAVVGDDESTSHDQSADFSPGENPNSKCVKKSLYVIRIGLQLVLISLFILQTGLSIKKFLAKETTVTFQNVAATHQPFPALSLCRYSGWTYNNYTFREAMENVWEANFLKMSRVNSNAVHSFATNGSAAAAATDEWSISIYEDGQKVLSKCWTYRPLLPKGVGLDRSFVALNLNSTALGLGMLFFHSPSESLLSISGNFGRTYHRIPPTSPVGEPRFISYEISVKKKILLSKGDLPCDKDNVVNVDKCLLEWFESKHSCILPWRRAEKGLEDSDWGEGVCRSREELLSYDAFKIQLATMGEKELYQHTGCFGRCVRHEYQFRTVLDHTFWDEAGLAPLFSWDDLTMTLHIPSGTLPVEKEVYVFDLLDCTANIGGYLGLLLGASLLSVYDGAQEILERLSRKIYALGTRKNYRVGNEPNV